ncbi:MAG: hypothetical protein AAFY17_10620 [Cyanobacteria bacterium J06642_11]
MKNHPIQPLEYDEQGVLRFKENAIVRHLLDNGGIGLNALTKLDFSDKDRQQFAQLIGYSHDGYGSLSFVDDEAYDAALAMHNNESINSLEARIEVLTKKLESTKQKMRAGVAELFEIHPDDLS